MATLRGEQGTVQFDAAGSSNATIVGTRSWSLTITKETLDTSKHGDTFRSFVGSMVSGSGTVELVYDPDATGQAGFLEDVVTTADPADATFELFTTGTTTGSDSVSFAGIITDMEITSTVGELVIVSCSFVTSGAITSNLE
ncbi:phage major tail protein 2 [uncultured Mediterranean phage uvMED]|nr:phage major tail protein 2 [uncultured Mediterranean phage uvMED]